MKYHKPNPRVGLVFPPFGPPHLANLGLAVLSAGIKARQFDCRTFFWSYRVMRYLPGETEEVREELYQLFTQRALSPWSEWVFMRHILPDQLSPRDPEVLVELENLDRSLASLNLRFRPSQIVLSLCNGMSEILGSMAQELARFDVIGVTTTFFQTGAALALCHQIKALWPEKLVILGGANCDGEMGRALLDNFEFIDCVFTGEVDHEVPEFVQRIHAGEPLEGIKGLHYRLEDGRVLAGPPSEPVHDMDSLPIPDFDDWISERQLFGLYDKRYLRLPLESSRGCWWGCKHQCIFCGLNANGIAYRQKSPERFQRELSTIVERYGVRYLFMTDNILSTRYYKTFVKWAREQGIGVDFFYEIKANMSREQVRALAEAGISMVQPGIEHFSSSILTLMRKGIRGIQNIAFLKYAAEYGVITVYSILAGFPGEDPKEYGRLARELPKLFHLTPPGGCFEIEFHRFSPYHNDPKEFGIRLRPHKKYSFIFPFDETMLAKLAYQFVVDGRRPQDLSYLAKIIAEVNRWRSEFRLGDCPLTWERDGDEILIRDRRCDFPLRVIRLRDYAVPAFLSLDEPTTLPRALEVAAGLESDARLVPSLESVSQGSELVQVLPVGRNAIHQADGSRLGESSDLELVIEENYLGETVIAFSREAFEANPRKCLEWLIEAGIVYEEDDYFLGLPVSADYQQPVLGWSYVDLPPSLAPRE